MQSKASKHAPQRPTPTRPFEARCKSIGRLRVRKVKCAVIVFSHLTPPYFVVLKMLRSLLSNLPPDLTIIKPKMQPEIPINQKRGPNACCLWPTNSSTARHQPVSHGTSSLNDMNKRKALGNAMEAAKDLSNNPFGIDERSFHTPRNGKPLTRCINRISSRHSRSVEPISKTTISKVKSEKDFILKK